MSFMSKLFGLKPNSWEEKMKFCGKEKIIEGIEQTKAMIPGLQKKVQTIIQFLIKLSALLIKVIPTKWSQYFDKFDEIIQKISEWAGLISDEKLLSSEAGKLLDNLLDEHGIDSESVRNLYHFIAGFITKKIKDE